MGELDILARQLLAIREQTDAALMIIQRMRGQDLTPQERKEVEEAEAKLNPKRWNPSDMKGDDDGTQDQ